MTRLALHFLFFLSGAAALGYQLVWTRLFATALGHEYPAVLAIISALMVGMAIGAFAIDRLSAASARPGYWLAGAELTIGAWAILSTWILPWANEWANPIAGPSEQGRHSLLAFALPALLLLPATMAMGATFPAMERLLSSLAPQRAWVGTVYAANTFGAVGGTLLAAHLLVPTAGLTGSCLFLGVLNLLIGIIILALSRRCTPRLNRATPVPEQPGMRRHRLATTLFMTGLLGIAYEAVGVRVLSQVLEGTVFTYAAALAVFLAGTAGGAAAYARWKQRRAFVRTETQPALLSRLLLATTTGCLVGLAMMALAPLTYGWSRGVAYSAGRALAAEMFTAASVFLLPSFCMGALFTHLMQSGRQSYGRIGEFVAINTLGAAVAPVFAVFALPQFGAKAALMLTSLAYLALAVRPSRWGLAITAVIAVAVGSLSNLRIVQVPAGGRILDYREGVMAAVAVVENPDRHRTLRVDNRYQMGGTAAAEAEYRQAHIPLLLHPKPRRALFLGLGTGISFGASSLYPGLTADGVELVPEIVQVMSAFAPQNFAPHTRTQLSTHVADARRFVRTTREHYDVIIGDLFHPYRDGAGALYTREHFTAIRQRLNTNGVFCQWLPVHQLDESTLKVILRTFLEVYPVAEAWLLRLNVDVPVIGLVGRNHPAAYHNAWIETQAAAEVREALTRLSLGDSIRFLGNFLAGRADLIRFTAGAPLNTDDHPRVTFMAPRHSYATASSPSQSLFALLQAGTPDLREALGLNDPAFASRVEAYHRARDVYLAGLANYVSGKPDAAIAGYLESARLSPDFTAGYAQCLSIAAVLAKSDPVQARHLLEKLVQAQPGRAVAREMLQRLSP